MQRARSLVSSALAFLAVLTGCQSVPPQALSVTEVEAAHAKLAQAYSTCDSTAFTDAYADEFTFFTSNTRSVVKTKDGLRAYLSVGCALKPNPVASVSNQAVRLFGGQAIVSGQYMFRVPGPNGVSDVPQNFTAVFTLQGGTWKVSAHHVSLVP